MLSRVKTLTLLVVCLLATGAIGATAAQAVEFHTEGGGETTITGADLENFTVYTNGSVATICVKNGSYQAAMGASTVPSLALTPAFGECAFSIPPSMGGCNFVLHASGAFGIEGATCASKPVEFKRGPNCTIKFGPQKVATGVSYANEGTGAKRDVKATISAASLHFSQMGPALCLIGGEGTFNTGKITFTTTLQAESEGKQKGLWVE